MSKYIYEKNRHSLTKYGVFCLFIQFSMLSTIFITYYGKTLRCGNQVKLLLIQITVNL